MRASRRRWRRCWSARFPVWIEADPRPLRLGAGAPDPYRLSDGRTRLRRCRSFMERPSGAFPTAWGQWPPFTGNCGEGALGCPAPPVNADVWSAPAAGRAFSVSPPLFAAWLPPRTWVVVTRDARPRPLPGRRTYLRLGLRAGPCVVSGNLVLSGRRASRGHSAHVGQRNFSLTDSWPPLRAFPMFMGATFRAGETLTIERHPFWGSARPRPALPGR